MRRRVIWVCLALAIAGPLASDARAAYGLALVLAEVGQDVLESAQEDADEAYDSRELMAVAAPTPGSGVVLAAALPAFDLFASTHCPEPRLSAFLAARRRHAEWRWQPPTARQRHALLQTFLL